MDRIIAPVGAAGAGAYDALAIGCFAAVCRERLGDRLLEFARQHPAVDVGVQEMGRSDLLAAVRSGSLAIAVLPGDPGPDLERAPVWTDRVVVAVPPGHPFVDHPTVSLGALRRERLLVPREPPGRDLHRFLAHQLAPLRPFDTLLCHGGRQRQIDQVAAGLGVALCCASQRLLDNDRIVVRPLDTIKASFTVNACWVDRSPAPALAALIGILHDAVAEDR